MDTNNQNVGSGEVKGCPCPMCQKWGWCPAWKHYRLFKWIAIIVVIILILKVLSCGSERGFDSGRIINTINVTGKGEVVVKPDIATVSFGVVKVAADVATAQTDSAIKMDAVLKVLKDNGVEDKDIKTTNYNIYPKYEYQNSALYTYGRQVMVGYEVSQTVSVKIRDLTKIGEILSGVGTAGATDISGLNFTVDDEETVKDEARDLAIQDARAQAKVLAKSLGVRLVKITSFSENGNYPVYYGMEKSMALGMGGADAVVPSVPTGENTITSNVNITYEIR